MEIPICLRSYWPNREPWLGHQLLRAQLSTFATFDTQGFERVEFDELDQCIVLSFQQDTKRLKLQRSFPLSTGSETIESEGFPELTKD